MFSLTSLVSLNQTFELCKTSFLRKKFNTLFFMFLMAPFCCNASSGLLEKVKALDFTGIKQELNNHTIDQDDLDCALLELCFKFHGDISEDTFDLAYDCIDLLLQKGADPNGPEDECEDGEDTPLLLVMNHLRCIVREEDILWLPEPIHEPIITPFQSEIGIIVVANSSHKTLVVQQVCKLINRLVDAGANPNRGYDDFSVCSPLQLAAFGFPEVVRCLLQAGANPNDLNNLHFDIYEGIDRDKLAEIRKIAKQNWDISIEDVLGKYGMSYAEVNFRLGLIDHLFEEGKMNKEAYDLVKARYNEICELLLQYGANLEIPPFLDFLE